MNNTRRKVSSEGTEYFEVTVPFSDKALVEIAELSDKAERLARGDAKDRAESAVLIQKIKTIRETHVSPDEMRAAYAKALHKETNPSLLASPEYRRRFDRYLANKADEVEMRDLQVGTQTVTWTNGLAGGYLVPFAYDETMRNAMAQVDPILDDSITDFSMTDGPYLQPGQVQGYDESWVEAQLIGEAAQQSDQGIGGNNSLNPQAAPPALGKQLRNNIIYRQLIRADFETEMDVPNLADKMVRTLSTALARRVARSVFQGQGGADMNGITLALLNQSVPLNNATPGKITSTDISNWFFAINAYYRNSPKCNWLCTDAGLKLLRNSVDSSNRPLLSMERDITLFGKRVLVCPSLQNNTSFRSLGVSSLIFGDCSALVIRSSRPTIQRLDERFADFLEKGYVSRWRADCAYWDPSNGANPPLTLVAIS